MIKEVKILSELINTLFDVLNFHITQQKDLIVIGLKDINKIGTILDTFYDISKINNKKFLYMCFSKNYIIDEKNKEPILEINIDHYRDMKNYFFESIADKVEDMINTIIESKKDGCEFAIINNDFKTIERIFVNKKPLVGVLKEICQKLDFNIVFIDAYDVSKIHAIGIMEQVSDLILNEESDHLFKTLKNRYGDRFDLIY